MQYLWGGGQKHSIEFSPLIFFIKNILMAQAKEKKERVVNYTTKNIKEFNAGDTICIKKMNNGFMIDLLCTFIKFERGIVTAKVVSIEQPHQNKFKEGDTVTSKLTNCYLWAGNMSMAGAAQEIYGCMWFKKDGFTK